MDIIALAGGYGTRLGELTINKPKALLDVNGKPLLDYTLNRLNKLENVGTIYIVSNAKFFKQLEEWAKTAKSPYPIKIINDGTNNNEERLEALGDLLFTVKQENLTDDILVIGTDNFFTFDLNPVVDKSLATQTSAAGFYDVKDRELAKQYGIAQVDEEGKITDFVEKPQDPPSTLSLMMLWYIQAKDTKLLGDLCDENGVGKKAGLFVKHLCENSEIYAVTFEKAWYDIGSPEEYDRLNANIKEHGEDFN